MKTANAISLKRTKLKNGSEGMNVIERFCLASGASDEEKKSMIADVTKWHQYKAQGRKDEMAMTLDKKVSGLKATIRGYAFLCRYYKDTTRLPRLISTLEMRDDTYQEIRDQIQTLLDAIELAKKGAKKVEAKVKLSSGYEVKAA